MTAQTRDRLLDSAEALFAQRGFYGVSIAAVADELSLTKQALLHHFGSKERLYGAVLKRLSDTYQARLLSAEAAGDARQRLRSHLLELAAEHHGNEQRAMLLMRELLDNRYRAEAAATWYLKPYLEALAALVTAIPQWSSATEARALAPIYQLLGAINYFAVSQPTLSGILGRARHAALRRAFPVQFEALIDAALAGTAP